MNKSILIGRITKDIEIRTAENDLKVCQFSIAVNRSFKNKDGKYDADFINCIAFRNTADFIGKYFKKGNQVCVEGRIQTRTYKKNEETRYITEIVVESILLLEKREKKEEQQEVEIPQNSKSEYDNNNTDIPLTDADLPF